MSLKYERPISGQEEPKDCLDLVEAESHFETVINTQSHKKEDPKGFRVFDSRSSIETARLYNDMCTDT